MSCQGGAVVPRALRPGAVLIPDERPAPLLEETQRSVGVRLYSHSPEKQGIGPQEEGSPLGHPA